ncbi:AfsR/SARP family transcriptional regulator [Verrucosispora sp. WMMD573]|uniref:AfsR/SARP family transcriptional regulator n=1 Tax=Verrucosispora sp. WMMD573 TaxID=3015149 RepID=UPI00248BF3AF|nr:AfsR/SARP family transcriptional regulator [Verrucosispora sp. WMMD573]WBB51950.1 BTAD domain-containing putative transcriptional regulator [Verrucosispora sp. WMMD573]
MTLRFTVLGPVGAAVDSEPVDVARPRRRAVLAYLLLNANRVVSVDQLTTAIWESTPPATARAQIQSEISALRWTLRRTDGAPAPLLTRPGGYLLDLASHELDLTAYSRLTELARAQRNHGRLPNARTLMRDALALWTGPALTGALASFVDPTRAGLEETRLADLEWLLDIELELGCHRDLIPELTQYVAEHPLRELLRAQLVVALYRSDRQPEALSVARHGRQLLRDEHGLDPGPLLRDLEHAVLRQDPSLDVTVGSVPTLRFADRPRPAQLPPASSLFVARQDDLTDLVRRLGGTPDRPANVGPQVVLLHGMPGVGKSALALQVAHTVAAAYPDGQLYVDLAGSGQPQHPDQMLDELLRVLGVPDLAIPTERTARVALLRSLFAERRCLLLLDDARAVDQVLPLLPAGAGCAVLVTARWQLDLPGAHRHAVAPLSQAQGLEVLAAHLGPDRLLAEPAALRALSVLCDGLPLALWFASCRMYRGRWAADLVALLRDPQHRLDALSTEDGSMRDNLAPSFRALTAAASLALRRLAVLPTATVPDWAPTICAGLAPREAMQALDELVGSHLLTPVPRQTVGPHRYLLPNLVRTYALTTAADGSPHADVPVTQVLARAADGWSVLAQEAVRRLAPCPGRPAPDWPPPPGTASRLLFSPAELDRLLVRPQDWLRDESENLATMGAVAGERRWSRPAAAIADAVSRATGRVHPGDEPSTARYARTLSDVARDSSAG